MAYRKHSAATDSQWYIINKILSVLANYHTIHSHIGYMVKYGALTSCCERAIIQNDMLNKWIIDPSMIYFCNFRYTVNNILMIYKSLQAVEDITSRGPVV